MASAFDVARYIIKSLPTDNLKLQKLLYYCQAVHLVLYDKNPLFHEEIEAWDYGPVVPAVYKEYRNHGFETIPSPDKPLDESSGLDMNKIRVIDMTMACFGGMSGTELINQTHSETPWKEAYRLGKPSKVITLDAIYTFFKDTLSFSDDEL